MIPSEKQGLQKMIFGNLSLLGISYQGRQKDRECREKFSNGDEMKKVMKVAFKYGVRLFAASSRDFNELSPTYLNAVKEIEGEEGTEIRLIACISIPLELRGGRINDYRRWKTHMDYEAKEFGEAVRERAFEDLILNCRPGWKENLRAAKPYSIKELEKELRINWKHWEESVDDFSDYHVAWIEPGSETDFLAISRMDLLEELLDVTRESGHRALLGSHHLGASAPLIQERRTMKFDGYVTPVNKLGVMMFPTQKEAENAIKRARVDGKLVIGIKPFAGGRIRPKEALTYVYREAKADSCMMGVSSVEEAEEDFRTARSILLGHE